MKKIKRNELGRPRGEHETCFPEPRDTEVRP